MVVADGLELGDTEVQNLEQVGAVVASPQEEVLRLEIAMENAGSVRRLGPLARLHAKIGRPSQTQTPFAIQQRCQVLTDQILHHDEGGAIRSDAKIDGRGNMLVLEGACGLSFAVESPQGLAPLRVVGPEKLHCEAPAHDLVVSFVDDPHPALS